MVKRLAVALVFVGTISALALAQGPRRHGEWEVKMEMNMPGMPANMPAMTSQQCITPAEARRDYRRGPAAAWPSAAYAGTMTLDMQGRGSMTMKHTGKRLGDCTK